MSAKMEGIWQPIETAPKDGTAILVYCPMPSWTWGKVITVAAWDGGMQTTVPGEDGLTDGLWRIIFGRWFLYSSEDPLVDTRECQPTHWMPLPEPPK